MNIDDDSVYAQRLAHELVMLRLLFMTSAAPYYQRRIIQLLVKHHVQVP